MEDISKVLAAIGLILDIYCSCIFYSILFFNQKYISHLQLKRTATNLFFILEKIHKTILRWYPIASGKNFKHLNVAFKALHNAIPFCTSSTSSCLVCLINLYLRKI